MQFKDAKREHHSLTAAAEKRLLIRIAERIPQPINSDHLTALGFVAMLAAGLSYWFARWNPCALVRRHRLAGHQLVRRFTRRNPGARPQPAAPAVRLLC